MARIIRVFLLLLALVLQASWLVAAQAATSAPKSPAGQNATAPKTPQPVPQPKPKAPAKPKESPNPAAQPKAPAPKASSPPSGPSTASNSTVPFPGAEALMNDDFYKPPANFESARLGTVFKTRKVPYPVKLIRGFEIKPAGAWQILYRTQNSVGAPEVTVVTVLQPINARPNNLFSLSFFTNSAYRLCNPSFALQALDPDDNQEMHFQTMIAVWALNQGYYVSIADDAGPGPSNPSGLQMGFATLDSIRAILATRHITGLGPDPIITLHGYSGGAVAAGWATELQPLYAPELKITAAAMGGMLTNLTHLSTKLNKSWYTTFSPGTMIALSRDYKALADWLDENLVPEYKQEYYQAAYQCQTSNVKQFAEKSLDKFYKRGYASTLTDAIPVGVLNTAGVMGQRSTPDIPWFLYANIGDQMSDMQQVTKLMTTHCSNGATIRYERNLKPLEHGEAALYRYPAVFKWAKDVHDGKRIEQICKTVDVRINSLFDLLPGEGKLATDVIMDSLAAMLGVGLGPEKKAKGAKTTSRFSIPFIPTWAKVF